MLFTEIHYAWVISDFFRVCVFLCTQRILHRADPSSKESGFRNPENGRFCEVMAGKAIKININISETQKYPKLKYFVIKKNYKVLKHCSRIIAFHGGSWNLT